MSFDCQTLDGIPTVSQKSIIDLFNEALQKYIKTFWCIIHIHKILLVKSQYLVVFCLSLSITVYFCLFFEIFGGRNSFNIAKIAIESVVRTVAAGLPGVCYGFASGDTGKGIHLSFKLIDAVAADKFVEA